VNMGRAAAKSASRKAKHSRTPSKPDKVCSVCTMLQPGNPCSSQLAYYCLYRHRQSRNSVDHADQPVKRSNQMKKIMWIPHQRRTGRKNLVLRARAASHFC
jgi:hypothetical protein